MSCCRPLSHAQPDGPLCAGVQLSVLRVFQAILADSSFRRQPAARELVHICTGVTRNLFTRLVPRLPEVEESGELPDTWQANLMIDWHAERLEPCLPGERRLAT